MDGVQTLILKAGHCPATSWANAGKFLRKISTFNATGCQILNAPNSISAGALPQIRLGSLQHSPDPVAAFNGPTSKEEGKGGGRIGEGKGRRGEGSVNLSNWGLWIWQWRWGGKEERQGGELGLGRPGTSFFHLKHCL